MGGTAECCTTRGVYLATLVLGIISVLVTSVGAVVTSLYTIFPGRHYRFYMLLPAAAYPLIAVCLLEAYYIIQVLILITCDSFPNKGYLGHLRTMLGKFIVLLILSLILFASCIALAVKFRDPVLFGISWVLVPSVCFFGLAWDLQKKLFLIIPGLPVQSPHRTARGNYSAMEIGPLDTQDPKEYGVLK